MINCLWKKNFCASLTKPLSNKNKLKYGQNSVEHRKSSKNGSVCIERMINEINFDFNKKSSENKYLNVINRFDNEHLEVNKEVKSSNLNIPDQKCISFNQIYDIKRNKVKKTKVVYSDNDLKAKAEDEDDNLKQNLFLPEDEDSSIDDLENEATPNPFKYSTLSGMTRKELYNSFKTGFPNNNSQKNNSNNKDEIKNTNRRHIKI